MVTGLSRDGCFLTGSSNLPSCRFPSSGLVTRGSRKWLQWLWGSVLLLGEGSEVSELSAGPVFQVDPVGECDS